MDTGTFTLIMFLLTGVFFIIQRSESKRRFTVILLMLVVLELIRRYAWYRDRHTEVVLALVVALVLNFGFWLFIGRYNPVGSSDDIKVLKMED